MSRGKCEGVQALLYPSEVGPNGGPTMIVPKDGSVPWETVGEASFERRWDQNNVRRSAESEDAARNPSARDDLYAQERPVRYKPGACFFWRYEVYHRGSAMKPAGLRVMHAFGFRRKDTPWHVRRHPTNTRRGEHPGTHPGTQPNTRARAAHAFREGAYLNARRQPATDAGTVADRGGTHAPV